jgi:hypothetical protein
MEQIDYESARKKFDEGYDCLAKLNKAGKQAVSVFAEKFYAGADYDLDTVLAQVELASSRLLIPCSSPLMAFARQDGDRQIVENFRLLPSQFDWFVR